MKNWLVKIAQQQPTAEENLQAAIEALPPEDLHELALDTGVTEPAQEIETFEEKLASADRMGRELAHLHGDELEKQAIAFLAPLAGMAARAVGGKLLGAGAKAVAGGAARSAVGNMAKNVVKDQAMGAVGDAVTSGFQRARAPQPAMAGGGGGFKYASALVDEAYAEFLEKNAGVINSLVSNVGKGQRGAGLVQSAGRMMMRDPKKALALGGAAVGAAGGLLRDPGYDEHGNRRSRLGAAAKGAVGGGAIGYGVGHLSPGLSGSVSGAGRDLLRAQSKQNLATGMIGKNAPKGLLSRTPGAAAAPAGGPAAAPSAPAQAPAQAPAAPAPAPSMTQQTLAAPAGSRMSPESAAQVASEVAASGRGPRGFFNRSPNVPLDLQDPSKVVLSSVNLAMLTPVERIKLAMQMKHANAGGIGGKLFSMTAPKTVANNLVHGAGAAIKKAPAMPPPVPAAARGGLGGVQKQLNSAQSVAGGGMPGMAGRGRPQITAMPGSGW